MLKTVELNGRDLQINFVKTINVNGKNVYVDKKWMNEEELKQFFFIYNERSLRGLLESIVDAFGKISLENYFISKEWWGNVTVSKKANKYDNNYSLKRVELPKYRLTELLVDILINFHQIIDEEIVHYFFLKKRNKH